MDETKKITGKSSFVCWADDKNLEKCVTDTTKLVSTNYHKIYAKWDDSVITLPELTLDGYTHTGWYSDKELTVFVANPNTSYTITENQTLYAKWEKKYSYIINTYSIDDNKKYIDKIGLNTTIDNFKKNIELNNGYSIDINYKTIDGENMLYTGGKTKIYNNGTLVIEYTNIIRGEVNGDGKINYLDYVNVYNHIKKTKNPESSKKELTS